jgi:hypothetical protein
MKIVTLTLILGLPLIALGQTADQQQTQTQTTDTQTTAPAKGKKMRSTDEQTEQTNVKGRTQQINRTETGARSSTSQTNINQSSSTKVNVQEFRSRHADVFSLGRHPKEFFVQRFGASHFRLIGNTYFVFVDGCWVSVDVDGFTYSERVICAGDPEFIAIE